MGIFQDILKPEESISGFNPGEPDDDVFKLESMPSYPGELPKFDDPVGSSEIDVSEPEEPEYEDYEPDAPEPDPIPQGVDDNIYDTPDEGSVWDIFDNPAAAKPESAEELELDDFANTDFSEPEGIDYNADEESSLGATPSVATVATGENLSKADSLKMDADLIALLQGDLTGGATQKPTKDTPKNIEPPPQAFVPVEEENQTVFIDFSEFNADSPSKAQSQNVTDSITDSAVNPIPEPKLSAKQAIKQQAKLEKDRKKEAKKANKKPFPWPLFWSSVAIFAMLSMFGEGGYYFWNKYIISKPHQTEEVAHATKEEPKEEPKVEEKHDVADTVKTDSQNPDSAAANPSNHEPAEPAKETGKDLAEQTNIHEPVEKPKLDEKKIVEKHEKIVEKKIEKKAEKIVEKKIEIKEKPILKKVKEKPVTKKVAIITAKENKPAKATTEAKIVKRDGNNEIYAIQVYASPSKKDAEAWLKVLEKKGIRGALLSPQKIRDQVWYRVRFGSYSGKEEARTAALRYGFAQSWIDRIK